MRLDLVAIGASTGGPGALTRLIELLPMDFQVPVAVALHMPSAFTGPFAARLARLSGRDAREAVDGECLEAGAIRIAPGDRHLRLERCGGMLRTRLDSSPPVDCCRPSVDVLFSSVAEIRAVRALAIVLSGMGRDGLAGARNLSAAKLEIWAQDQASAVAGSMPGAIVQAGLAQRTLAIERMASELATFSSYSAPSPAAPRRPPPARLGRPAGPRPDPPVGQGRGARPDAPFVTLDEPQALEIARFVQSEAGISYDASRRYILASRVASLIARLRYDSSQSFLQAFRHEEKVRRETLHALLTHETSFLRDGHPFEAIETQLLPSLQLARGKARRLALWSAGCSTGQEAYSLAMILLERHPVLARWDVEIVASDVSRDALARASEGRYSNQEVERGLPERHLGRFLKKDGSTWRVSDEVRRLVRFREVNLIRPFPVLPRFDLVLLRNVLIYFEPREKREVLRRVRATLQPDGYLFLGTAETTIGLDQKFERARVGRSECYRPTGTA